MNVERRTREERGARHHTAIHNNKKKNTGNNNNLVFHAGTKLDKNKEIVTKGGRVLNIVSKEKTFKKARSEAYKSIRNIKCSNLFYRDDIGE